MAPFGIDHEDCNRSVQMILPTGQVRRGAFAVNRFLWAYWPYKALVAVLYLVPPLLLLESLAYFVVARNRYHISRWLGYDACTIRDGDSEVHADVP